MNGRELRTLRYALGLTQKQLAEQLAVRTNTVARYERDELRIREPIARLAQLLVKRDGGGS